jgi:drug/metabolite transporter superfamily protein YnfA
MNLNPTIDLITIIAALLGILGGYYLVRSIVRSGTKEIVGMASTFYGDNPILIDTLSTQKADSTCGFGLATLSGVFWLISAFTTFKVDGYQKPLALILIFGVLCVVICNELIQRLRTRTIKNATLLSFANHANSYMQPWSENLNPTKLIEDAKRMNLGYLIRETGTDIENLLLLLNLAKDEEIISNFNRAIKSLLPPS